MSLHADLKTYMKDALAAKDKERLSTLRGLVSALTNEAVKKGEKPNTELSDDEVTTVIQRQVKQRKDSIEQYTQGGRIELAEQEKAELTILEAFLPAHMSEEDIKSEVQHIIRELGVTSKESMGEVMKEGMARLKGKADGGEVKRIVSDLLD